MSALARSEGDRFLEGAGAMVDLIKQLTLSQMEAALCTLDVCVTRCPESMWDGRVGNLTVNQAAFHALFFVDFYLNANEAMIVDVLKRQPFHLVHADAFRDYEEVQPRRQALHYERPFISSYIQHCRQKAAEVINAETAESLAGPSGFNWRSCSRAELHVYNTRHVQHHAAQISLRLRIDAGIDIPWIGQGWREPPPAPT